MRIVVNGLMRLAFVSLFAALVVGTGSAAPASAASASVSIENFAFSPGDLTINVGDTVTWVNNDTVAHTATATDGSFDTGEIAPGTSASITFNTAGTFGYICSIHSSMTGTITVLAADITVGGTDGDPVDLPNTGSGPTSGGGSNQVALMLCSLALVFGAGGFLLRRRPAPIRNISDRR